MALYFNIKLALKSEDTKNNLGAPGFSDRVLVTADASCQALFGTGDKNNILQLLKAQKNTEIRGCRDVLPQIENQK